MIRAQGSVPYPPQANSQPIRQFAASLRQLSAGLQQSSGQLTSVAATTQSAWHGAASQAFGRHVEGRSRTVGTVATAVGNAAPVLDAYAAAIDTTSAAYTSAAIAEHAARAGMPWTSAALAAAIAAQKAAVASLYAAGATCASALMGVNGQVASALFAGVDHGSAASVVDGIMEVWGRVSGLTQDAGAREDDLRTATADLDLAMWEVESQIDAIGAGSGVFADRHDALRPDLGRGTTSEPLDAHVAHPRPQPADDPATIAGNHGSDWTPFGWATDPFEIGVGRQIGDFVEIAGHMDALDAFVQSMMSPAARNLGRWTFENHQISPILDAQGRPIWYGPDGQPLPPRYSHIVDVHGRPFPMANGQPQAPGIVTPGRGIYVPPNGGMPGWTPASGTVEQRLAQISRQIDQMHVNVHQPGPRAVPVSAIGPIERGARMFVQGASRVGNVLGLAVGANDVYRGYQTGDNYRVADGLVTATLAAAGFIALANPVGLAGALILGIGWGVASALSGDVPVTRRIAEATGNAMRRVRERAPDAFRETFSTPVTGPAVVVRPAP